MHIECFSCFRIEVHRYIACIMSVSCLADSHACQFRIGRCGCSTSAPVDITAPVIDDAKFCGQYLDLSPEFIVICTQTGTGNMHSADHRYTVRYFQCRMHEEFKESALLRHDIAAANYRI